MHPTLMPTQAKVLPESICCLATLSDTIYLLLLRRLYLHATRPGFRSGRRRRRRRHWLYCSCSSEGGDTIIGKDRDVLYSRRGNGG
jgi:hypothetical protein